MAALPPHAVLPRQHLVGGGGVKVGGVGDSVLVRSFPWMSFNGQHRHVFDRWQTEETVGSKVRAAVGSHEVPRRPPQRQEVIGTVVPLPPPLAADVLRQLHRQSVTRRQVTLPELAGRVEASVEGDVEQARLLRAARAGRMVLHPRVEYHLGDELVGGEPGGVGPHPGNRQPKSAVRHVWTHIRVHIQAVAFLQEADVELRRQFVDVNQRLRFSPRRRLHGHWFHRRFLLRLRPLILHIDIRTLKNRS